MVQSLILDTDTFNEADDQFALAHCLLSPSARLEAVYAAPFKNDRAATPGEGMRLSYEEIHRVCDLAQRQPSGGVFLGSEHYLEETESVPDSPAAQDLIARARCASPERPVLVVAIACLTNLAAAIRQAPDIGPRLRIVWLGSNAPWWPNPGEFNLSQDIPAARTVLQSGADVTVIPCSGVASHLLTTMPELERYVEPCGTLGRYLCNEVRKFEQNTPGWRRIIWDIAATAFVLDPACAHTQHHRQAELTSEGRWHLDSAGGRPLTMVTHVHSHGVFGGLFNALALAA